MNRRMFVPAAIFIMLFSLLCMVSAEAHTFTIVPDLKIHQVPVGSEYTAKLTNTEAFLYPDLYRVSADVLVVRFLYKDESETVFPEFKTHSFDVKVKSGDKEIIGKKRDYAESKAILEKEGTVVLDARIVFPYYKWSMRGYSKQILNAQKDGRSTKRVGGDNVLEIVPLSEVSDFVPGKTVAFQLFFKGKPKPGARVEWADEKSPVVRPRRPDGRLGSPENTTEVAITDENGIFDFTLRNAGYNCFGSMAGAKESGQISYYPSTLIVDVPASAAGGSISAVIPVEPKLPDAVSEDKSLQSVAAQPLSDLDRAQKVLSADSPGFTSSHLVKNSSGAVTVSQTVAAAARAAAEKACGKPLPGKVNPMPILKAKLEEKSSADIAVMGIELMGSALAETSPANVKLIKVTGPETGELLGYLPDPAEFGNVKDGAFTILDDKGTVVSSIYPGKKYVLTLLIKDNGSFDLSRDAKTIVDPVVLLASETPTPNPNPKPNPDPTPNPKPNPDPTPNPKPNPNPTPNPKPNPDPTPNPKPNPDPTPNPSDSSKGGGCDAGYGGLALALAAAFLPKRKA